MSDWKIDLENKAKELNLTEGGSDGQGTNSPIRSDRVGSSRSSNSIIRSSQPSNPCNSARGGSRGVFRSGISKEALKTKDERRKLAMITVEGALKDLEVIEKEAADSGSKAVVKALKVVVKFLSTMRSNQLLTEEEKVVIRKAREARAEKDKK
jgi:hypothetical protein